MKYKLTRNQIIAINILLAPLIVPVRLVLFIAYYLSKWQYEGVEWLFDHFPALIPVPKTQEKMDMVSSEIDKLHL